MPDIVRSFCRHCNPMPNRTGLEQEEIILILNKINEIDENDDPNYIVYAQDVLFSYVGSIYPELLNKEDVNSVACAISLYVDSLFSIEEDFEIYKNYQLSICERPELLGASSHIMDILRK